MGRASDSGDGARGDLFPDICCPVRYFMQALHDADEVSTQKRGGHLMSPFDNSSCIASDDIPKALKSSLKNAGLVLPLIHI